MAIGRLSMKVGKAGKAGPHAAYIAREGQYANRLERGERLEATEAGNMPSWAEGQPQDFWQAADAFERSNGTTYREMEIAIPRELDSAQRIELAKAWVEQEIGDRHAYQWAIHVPTAADGGEQPHLHLMFSERQVDGIDRDPDQYFKRYNAKSPEKGGARKGYGERAGQTLTRSERAADLKAIRGRWEEACNHALEQAGIEARIDMRSHAERGLDYAPEAKQLPSQWRDQEQRAQVIEYRAARAEQQQAAAELRYVLPDVGAAYEAIKARTSMEQQRNDHPLTTDSAALERQRKARLAQERRELREAHEAAVLAVAGINAAETFAAQQPTTLAAENQKATDAAIDSHQLDTFKAPAGAPRAITAGDLPAIKKEWEAERAQRFAPIKAKAERIVEKAEKQKTAQWQKLQAHDKAKPVAPSGLLKSLKQASYEQAAQVWGKAKKQLEKRWHQLRERVSAVAAYTVEGGSMYLSKGEQLAERKLAQERPDLAKSLQQAQDAALELRKQKAQEQARERQQQREKGKDRGGFER